MLGLSVSPDSTDDVGEKVAEGSRRGMRAAVLAGFRTSQEVVSEDTGELKNSGKVVDGQDGSFRFQYDADHDVPVEGGTEPHWPPIEPLKGWARRILGDEQAAYAVQHKIAEEGTEPQHFMQAGFEEMARELNQRGLSPHIEGELGGPI